MFNQINIHITFNIEVRTEYVIRRHFYEADSVNKNIINNNKTPCDVSIKFRELALVLPKDNEYIEFEIISKHIMRRF